MRRCDASDLTPADVGLVRVANAFPADNAVIFANSNTIAAINFVRAVGFGETEEGSFGRKLYVDIPIASPDCGGAVNLTDGQHPTDQSWYGCTPRFELVAGQSHLNRDTCHGDSGGPVFAHLEDGDNSYREYLVGITSRGVTSYGSRDCGDGGIYTRVDREVLQYIRGQGVTVQTQEQ
jgi:secreted trypsin-like serine protease